MDYSSDLERFNKMLLIVLWRGGYPHQVLSFLLNKGITYPEDSGEDSSNAYVGKCQALVEAKSGNDLAEIAAFVQTEYGKESEIEAPVLASMFQMLHLKMALTIAEYVDHFAPKDKTALIRYAPIRNTIIKNTNLKDYFGKNPAHNVTDWCHKVKQRTEEQLIGSKANQGWQDRSYDDFLDSIVEERTLLIERFPHCAARYYRLCGNPLSSGGITE